MSQTVKRYLFICGTLIFAAAGFFLRKSGAMLPLIILCVVFAGLLIAGVCTLRKQKALSVSAPDFLLSLLGAGALAAAGVLQFAAGGRQWQIMGVLCLVTALCFVSFAAAQQKEKTPPAFAALIPIACFILQLILDFKAWSSDPIIVDYCFKLFSLVCILLALYHAGGCAFGECKRRPTVLFSLAAVFFTCVAIPDGDTVTVLLTTGASLFLLGKAWTLLGKTE